MILFTCLLYVDKMLLEYLKSLTTKMNRIKNTSIRQGG